MGMVFLKSGTGKLAAVVDDVVSAMTDVLVLAPAYTVVGRTTTPLLLRNDEECKDGWQQRGLVD